MPYGKMKYVTGFFKFGGREKKTKTSSTPRDLPPAPVPIIPESTIDKSPVDDSGSLLGFVFPLSGSNEAVNGDADLRDDATSASVNKIHMRQSHSFSSGSTSYKSAHSLFDSRSLWMQSQSGSLTTIFTDQSAHDKDMLASESLTLCSGEARTEDASTPPVDPIVRKEAHNINIAQNEGSPQSAIQSDDATDSNISVSPVDKGKSVPTDSQSRSFDYSTARRWSWDESDMEFEDKLTQQGTRMSLQMANDRYYNANSATLMSKGKQISREQCATPPIGRAAYVRRHTRKPVPRLPYTLTIYQAGPRSLVPAGLSNEATTSTSKVLSDRRGDEVSDDADWLDKFIRDEEVEMAKMIEEDRLLAEELQRIENEMQDYQPTDYTEESIEEIIRRIDAEEEAARLQELELLCAGDAELAAELERQEQEEFEVEQRRERERQEAESRNIGVPVLARQVNTRGRLNDGGDGGVEAIGPEMVEMLKRVKELFKQSLPTFNIHRIDLIVNPKLQLIYEQTRREFEKLGRSTEEAVLFHGTHPKNVEPYFPITRLDVSNGRILTGGFKIGGVGGHRCANGQSLVISGLSPASDGQGDRNILH